MSKLDELKASLAALNSSVSAELDAINAKLASIQSGTSDADLQGVIDDINTLKGKVDGETAALSATAPADGVPASS